jgi:hypothetical protein
MTDMVLIRETYSRANKAYTPPTDGLPYVFVVVFPATVSKLRVRQKRKIKYATPSIEHLTHKEPHGAGIGPFWM